MVHLITSLVHFNEVCRLFIKQQEIEIIETWKLIIFSFVDSEKQILYCTEKKIKHLGIKFQFPVKNEISRLTFFIF